MTVFAPQMPFPNQNGFTPDYSSAEIYGPLEFVFSSGEKVHLIGTPSLQKARRVLKNFNPETDYILHPGNIDPIANNVVMFAIAELNLEYVNFLKWDKKRNQDGTRSGGYYTPIKVNLRTPK